MHRCLQMSAYNINFELKKNRGTINVSMHAVVGQLTEIQLTEHAHQYYHTRPRYRCFQWGGMNVV